MCTLRQHSESRTRISRHLAFLSETAKDAGLPAISQRIGATQSKVDAETLKVAVVGEFSTGKSSLINALLGEDLLPTAARICTAVPTSIRGVSEHESPGIRATLATGVTRELDPEELDDALAFGPDTESATPFVQAEICLRDQPWLGRYLEIIDTPGVNDRGLRGERTTLEFLPRADVIIFITRVDQLLKASEVTFLQQRVVNQDLEKIILVVNAIDCAEADDIPDVRDRLDAVLQDMSPRPQTFLVSAKDARHAQRSGDADALASSGITPLKHAIEHGLESQGGASRLRYWEGLVRHYTKEITRHLLARRESLQIDHNLRKHRAERIGQMLERLPEDTQRMTEEATHLVAQLRAEVEAQAKQETQALGRRISEARVVDGAPEDLAAVAESELSSAVRNLQSQLRSGMPPIHDHLARQMATLFGELDAVFSEVSPEAVSVDANDLDWRTLVESCQPPVPSAAKKLAPGIAGLGIAGLGVTLGAMAAIPVLGAIALGGIGLSVLAFNVHQRRSASDTFAQSIRQADDLAEKINEELLAAIQTALGAIQAQTTRDLQLIIRTKEEELKERQEDLLGEHPDAQSVGLSAEEVTGLLAKLEQGPGR